MTLARSPTALRAAENRRIFSLSLSVGASPVVPHTTTPSEPLSTRYVARSRNRSTSTEPSALNGVTIAVITEPSIRSPILRGKKRSSAVAAVDEGDDAAGDAVEPRGRRRG